jgi:hypothetical protein
MKASRLAVITFSVLSSAFSAAQAHQIDPSGKIEVTCPAADTLRMAAIASATRHSRYWAPQSARKQMLALAQHACERGAMVVTFVPPTYQRQPDESPVARTAR